MKKILQLVSVFCLTGAATAQVPKYCLLEQFTQASCGPCAQQNPGFKTNVLTPNPQKVKLVAYHTSWPGTDPMYNYNTGASAQRVNFYGISGVPYVFMMGNQKATQPSGISQADVDDVWNSGSPIKLTVTEVDNGADRDVTVQISSIIAPPAGNYELYVACIHRNAVYTTAPGTNGEKNFPSVFRCMISGNPQTLPTGNANGVSVTLPAMGSSITMGPYNYLESWAINSQTSELAAIAWLQNTATKEIIQCGSTYDTPVNGILSTPATRALNGPAAAVQTFSMTTKNIGSASETFTYSLTNNAPSGWVSDFVVNGQTYATTATVTIPAGTTYSIQVNATPNTTVGVGKYTLTMQSVTNPGSPANSTNVYVFSGITDLVVSNTAATGSGTGSVMGFQTQYMTGLQNASSVTHAATEDKGLLYAMRDNAMGQIKYIYWNVGWSFPTFASDELATEMENFLDAGGCLFVSGQDIGWDIWDAAGNGTAVTKSFYTNYLNASYTSDGVAADNQLTANTTDSIFGASGNHSLSTAAYGASYFFPDNIKPTGIGQAIYYIKGDVNKAGGVRATNGTFKTVYLTPGIEQMSTAASKNTILKLSYDWFHMLTGIEDFDNAMKAVSLGQNFPNPCFDHTFIPIANMEKDAMLQVMDLTGRVLAQHAVQKGTMVFNLNTSSLETGMYLYRVTDGENASGARPMQVIR